jgi:hypothetical protein
MVDDRVVSIYGLVDPRTDLIRYVGKTVTTPTYRLRQHINCAKRNRQRGVRLNHRDNWILSLIAAGTEPTVVTLEEILPGEDWATSEIKWIASLSDHLTNEAAGGQGPHGIKRSEETRSKLSAARKLIVGWHHSEETRKKIGDAQRGKPRQAMSEESRRKISESTKGRPKTEEHRAKIGEGLKGRKLSEDSRQKVSRSLLKHNYPPDDELIAMAETMGWAAISRETGIPESSIRQRVHNIRERGW